MNTPYEILQKAKEMKKFISAGCDLNSVMENFEDFKQRCPKLFEMVLENKGNYMEELENMVSKAGLVSDGTLSLGDATKVIKNKYDNKYIYPYIKSNTLTEEQKQETKDYIKNQQEEAESIEKKIQDKL